MFSFSFLSNESGSNDLHFHGFLPCYTAESLIILFPDERPLAYLLAEHPQKKAARFISVTFRQNVEITTYNAILVFERAHISLNSSFIKLENFEFKCI